MIWGALYLISREQVNCVGSNDFILIWRAFQSGLVWFSSWVWFGFHLGFGLVFISGLVWFSSRVWFGSGRINEKQGRPGQVQFDKLKQICTSQDLNG